MTCNMPDAPTVANSSCLIALDRAGLLGTLQSLYGTILIPSAVAGEWGVNIPTWVLVQTVQNQALVQSLCLELGSGEAEAIALAAECSATRVILNDKKARRIARQLLLPVTGTLAILV